MKTAPTSSAEVLRAIPGVRSESSGGEGNANMTVRGVPISAGGARYVEVTAVLPYQPLMGLMGI